MGRRRGREPLTEERILCEALRLVDEAGLDALSMRRLGAELGVDPMAVYHHVPNKEALLHGVVRLVFTGMAVPDPAGPWERRVRDWAHAYRAVAREHPNLVLRIVTDPGAVAVAAVHANEALYRALEESGLPRHDVVRAADVVVDFVNGSVLGEVSGAASNDAVRAFREALDAQPPEAVAAQRRVLGHDTGGTPRHSFELGLDLLLAGLQARLTGRRAPG
jgi:TetR/AcrR family transcriptional regulator, tetracycline repressor protein